MKKSPQLAAALLRSEAQQRRQVGRHQPCVNARRLHRRASPPTQKNSRIRKGEQHDLSKVQ